MSILANQGKTYIDSSGKFRLEVPITHKATTTGPSDLSITNADMTLIFHGSLDEKSGFLTFGIGEFGNSGCSSSVTFEKR